MRLCDNAISQERGQNLLAALAGNEDLLSPSDIVPSFVHVVSPFACEAGSENDNVQRVTFEAMARAKTAYEAVSISGKVQHCAACFDEDVEYAFRNFETVGVLTASSLNFTFQVPHKLPLLFDILDVAALSARDDDYIIFTNTDICLTLGFYDTVASLIRLGFEALVINRRTVEKFTPIFLPVAGASLGQYHPGFDCFVFKASMLRLFTRTTAIIGRGGVMQSLLANLIIHARRLLILKDVHLTYHLGDDRSWSDPKNNDYIRHNLAELHKVLMACGSIEQDRLRKFGYEI